MGDKINGTKGSSVTYRLVPRHDKPGMDTIWEVNSPAGECIATFEGRRGKHKAHAYSEAYSYGYFSALALVRAGMLELDATPRRVRA